MTGVMPHQLDDRIWDILNYLPRKCDAGSTKWRHRALGYRSRAWPALHFQSVYSAAIALRSKPMSYPLSHMYPSMACLALSISVIGRHCPTFHGYLYTRTDHGALQSCTLLPPCTPCQHDRREPWTPALPYTAIRRTTVCAGTARPINNGRHQPS